MISVLLYLWYHLKANYTLIVKFIISNSKYKSIFQVVFPKAAKKLTLYHLRSCPSWLSPQRWWVSLAGGERKWCPCLPSVVSLCLL